MAFEVSKNSLKEIGLHIFLFFAAAFFGWLFSYKTGAVYTSFFGGGGSFIDLTSIGGFPFSYVFFVVLLFAAFGGGRRYVWGILLMLPFIWFEVRFDGFWLERVLFPISLVLLAWSLGEGIRWILKRYAPKLIRG